MAGRGRGAAKDSEEIIAPTPEEFELARFLEESGGTIAKVYIYRLAKNGDLDHVDTTSVEGMNEETIREKYGAPSVYVLKFKASNGKFIAERRVRLGETKIGVPEHGSSVPVPGGGVSDLLKMQLDMMQARVAEQNAMMNTLLAGIISRPQAAVPDPSAMMTALATVFTTLHGAANKTTADPFENIAKVAELIRTLAPDGGGGDSKEDNLFSVVKEIGGRVVEIARPIIESGTRQVVALNPGAPAPAGAPGTAQLPAKTEGDNVNRFTIAQYVGQGIAYLKGKARAGKDAELFVDFVLENGEEPQNAALIGAIQQGVTFEQLLQFDPEIAQNPDLTKWFRILYDGIHAELFNAGGAALDSERAGGNAGDAGNNAAAGAPGLEQGSDKLVS
jgi:hypothetical protein